MLQGDRMHNYAYLMKTVADYGQAWKTIGTDLQYMVKDRVLFLQPTSSNHDWKKNFQFIQVPYKCGSKTLWVHKGFLDVYLEGRELFLKLLQDGVVDTVCGFSHGSALATILYWEYFMRHGIKIPTVVFGSPRVCNTISAIVYRKMFDELINLQMGADIVSSVPPVIFFYMHVGIIVGIETGYLIPLPRYHRPEVYLEHINILLT